MIYFALSQHQAESIPFLSHKLNILFVMGTFRF